LGRKSENPLRSSLFPLPSSLFPWMSAPASVTASGLTKRYGTFTALRDASFAVSTGELVGLIGPNGSGKTTLLEVVAGLLHADAGTVTVNGRPVDRDHRVGTMLYLPDGIRPWPQQTVDWVLRLAEGLFGGTATNRQMAVDRLLLEPLLGARMETLSKGEHKRVMLAIGVTVPQPILMLDEPFDGLDLRQTREVMTLLREVAVAGRGLFVSIHQLSDAARVADRLVLLSNGAVVGAGTLPELRASTNLPEGSLEDLFLALT
jgi:ABC-2 type transport system ATP-binding protein